jgi:hypothetical protein
MKKQPVHSANVTEKDNSVLRPTSSVVRSLLVVIGAVALIQPALAQTSEPANKPAVAINRGSYSFVNNGETVRILQETVKTSSPSDLLLAVTAESSILTHLITAGNDASTADGAIRVYITIDGQIVHPTGGSGAPGHQTNGDTAHVVFANQTYSRTTTGFSAQETIDDYIQTKHAAGFNWAVLNVGAGTHKIEVFATYNESETGKGMASGIIGNRSLVVQPVKCQVNETVVDNTQDPVPTLPVPLG